MTFRNESKLEKIERRCFSKSGIETIVIPKTLRTISASAFEKCQNLSTVLMDDGCTVSLSCTGIPASANVGFLQEMTICGSSLSELRQLKQVTIPDGTERIGNYWFWGSEVENVEISASVREIGIEAFCNCKSMRKVVFETGGETGAKAKKDARSKTTTSSTSQLKVICENAFHGCNRLRNITLPNCLEEIGLYAFCESGLESLTIPSSVKSVHQGAFYLCKGLNRAVIREGLEILGTSEQLNDGEQWCGVF